MSGLTDDWDSVPVNTPVKNAAASSSTLISDWDAVPVKSASVKPSPSAMPDVTLKGMKQANSDAVSGIPRAALNQASGLGAAIIGGWRGLATLAMGGSVDDAANAVRQEEQTRTYQPAQGTAAARVVNGLASPINPMNYPALAGGYVGGKVLDATGSPALATAVDTGINALPLAFLRKGGAANADVIDVPIRQEPTMPSPGTLQSLQESGPNVWRRNPGSGDSVAANSVPSKPQTTQSAPIGNTPSVPAQTATEASTKSMAAALAPTAEDIAQTPSQLPAAEQSRRAQILQRIGMESARESAIKGDAMAGATQAQMARFNEPAGLAAKEQFDAERGALQSHAENIVNGTGGTMGMDERTLNVRGQTVAAPFDALREWFDNATSTLYKAADEKSGGLPSTNLDAFGKLINTESQFAGKAANGALGNGIRSYFREQGIMDKDGNMSPITAQQAEGIKQYINSQWSPETSGLAGKIKGSIDDDVFKSAGEDVYAQARNMYRLKKQTLDNPSGVSKLMDFDPQTPINRATPYQKLPDALTNLSPSQFKHVVDTLKNMPDELQPLAQSALDEIKGHMANQLLSAGSKFESKWNAKGITKELQNNSAKYPMVFDVDTLQKISDLNDAGHILSVDKSYPGAAAQAANAMKQGMMSHVVGGATAVVGGGVGSLLGPFGSAAGAGVGRMAGNAAATSMGEAAAVKKFNKGVVKLSDFPK